MTETTAKQQPLVSLSEDEILFRDNVRQFAEERVRPLVREMDEKGVFDHDLLQQFFLLGLMGIEIPEQYGGGGGTFFEACLAVEEMACVDASAAVIVDVQNTLVNKRTSALGQPGPEEALFATPGGRVGRSLCAQRGRFRLRCLRSSEQGRAQGF